MTCSQQGLTPKILDFEADLRTPSLACRTCKLQTSIILWYSFHSYSLQITKNDCVRQNNEDGYLFLWIIQEQSVDRNLTLTFAGVAAHWDQILLVPWHEPLYTYVSNPGSSITKTYSKVRVSRNCVPYSNHRFMYGLQQMFTQISQMIPSLVHWPWSQICKSETYATIICHMAY